MKDYATMSNAEWAMKFNLATDFTILEALIAMKRSIDINAGDKDVHHHGHMCRGRNGEHILYVGLPYRDERGYNYRLMWNLDKRVVKVVKEKRYYPQGIEYYQDYIDSYFSVTFPETNWLVQRVLKAFEVRGSNKAYNKLWGAFTQYCFDYREELL